MSKLAEKHKLKLWLSSQFTLVHILLGIVLWQLTEGWVPHLILGTYIVWSVLTMVAKLAVIVDDDPDYLRLPKK